MTARVFQAIFGNPASAESVALRSGKRRIGYRALADFLCEGAEALRGAPRVVGIAGADPLEAALADLALTYSGRTVVHLPPFFSPDQLSHIVSAAGVDAVIGDQIEGLDSIVLTPPEHCQQRADAPPDPMAGAGRIIFTSGSSGQPKGVVIGERQMAAAIAGLEDAIEPKPSDRHLSLLPMAQLLEQIGGLYLPLLAGAEVWFCPEALSALFGGPVEPVLSAMEQARPTTTILVPALLRRIVAGLKSSGREAPESLRLVALGGAICSPDLLVEAEAAGLPVLEGYGLSECCSVVALNRPRDAMAGTVGRPLAGVDIRIDQGEIVVSGPTVMEGYLGQPPVSGAWRTGDLGRIENGRLIVEGRKDWLIVTPEGRNINPEWVEACLEAERRIIAAGLHLAADEQLEVVIAALAPVDPDAVTAMLSSLPIYARPVRAIVVPASLDGLIRPAGGIDRSRLAGISGSFPSMLLSYEQREDAA